MALCVRVVYITLSEYLVPRKYLNNKNPVLYFGCPPTTSPTSNVGWDDANEVIWFSLWSVFMSKITFNEALALVPFLHRWSHEGLSKDQQLVVNTGRPRRPTPLILANHHRNLLVAIYVYNTWAALPPQADRKSGSAPERGSGSHRGLWTKPGSSQRDGIVLLICFAANFLPLCSIQWDSGLRNGVWMTDLKTAGSPLQLLTIMDMHILKLLNFSLKP